MPDLPHGNSLVEGASRAILEGDLNLLRAVLWVFDPVHPIDGRGKRSVLPEDPVAFAQQLGHDIFDLVGVHARPFLLVLVGRRVGAQVLLSLPELTEPIQRPGPGLVPESRNEAGAGEAGACRGVSALRVGVRQKVVDLGGELLGELEERAVSGVRVDHQA